ncbi:MAG: outer membrane beta-barrel protein [Crocinitomicaceae bacterium]|nr:outer membrane beta-barrel protein [Crocinitomicaceae bacterium]
MKHLIIIFLAFISFFSYSQETKRHLIGAGFSPEACYRTMGGGEPVPNIDVFAFGFTAGFTYQYNIKWWVAIETGVFYSDKGSGVDFSGLGFGDQIDPRRGFIYNTGDNIYNKQKLNLVYLEIPVKFNFYFSKSKVKPFLGIGFLNNVFLMGGRNYTSYDRSSWLSPYNLQGIVSMGIDFDFSKSITMRIEPQFKHSIISIWKDSGNNGEYPYSIGCMVGLYYRLEK